MKGKKIEEEKRLQTVTMQHVFQDGGLRCP